MSRLDDIGQEYEACTMREYHSGRCMDGCTCAGRELTALRAVAQHVRAIDHDAQCAFMSVPVAWFRHLDALATSALDRLRGGDVK